MRVDGVDLSKWQGGAIDLAQAKAGGLRWVYHRATVGAGTSDPLYARRRVQAATAGLPFGAYHAAFPDGGDAKAEAANFLRHATPRPGDLVPMLDLETNSGRLNRAQLTEWVGAWVHEIQRALKVTPIIYTPFDLDHNFGCLLWMARYNNSNTPPQPVKPWKQWDIWQFSNGNLGVPNAIRGLGHVDLNHMRRGLRLGDFRIPVPPPPDPPPSPPSPKRTAPIRFVSQNVRAKPEMLQKRVEADVNLTASQAGVVGWQEIVPERYRQAIRDLGPDWTHVFGVGTDEAISWRTRWWTLVDQGQMKLTEKAPGLKGTDTDLLWVVLESYIGARIVVNVSHYLPRAWGPRTGQEAKEQAERQRLWTAGNQVHRGKVAAWVAQGYPVVGMGDFNSQLRRDLTMGEAISGKPVRYAVGDQAVDQLWFVDGADWSWVIDDADGELLPGRNSDHPGRRARAALVERTTS